MPDIDYRTSTPADNLDIGLLVARILLVAIFPISGYFKIIQWPGIIGYLTQLGAPLPEFGGYLAVLVEMLCPVLVALGLFIRWAALALILYTLGTSILAHRFWEFMPPAQFGQMVSFFKNLWLVAGLGLIMLIGPGRYALQPGR